MKLKNTTKIELSNILHKNYKTRNSAVEWNIKKIVRKAFSKIDFDVRKKCDLFILTKQNLFNSSDIMKEIDGRLKTRPIKLNNISLNLKIDFEVKFSLHRIQAMMNAESPAKRYQPSACINSYSN